MSIKTYTTGSFLKPLQLADGKWVWVVASNEEGIYINGAEMPSETIAETELELVLGKRLADIYKAIKSSTFILDDDEGNAELDLNLVTVDFMLTLTEIVDEDMDSEDAVEYVIDKLSYLASYGIDSHTLCLD